MGPKSIDIDGMVHPILSTLTFQPSTHHISPEPFSAYKTDISLTRLSLPNVRHQTIYVMCVVLHTWNIFILFTFS